jgi:hypothetical protein
MPAEQIAELGFREPPPAPPEIYRVLPIFYRLCGTRDYVQNTPIAIRDSEILAWSQLRGEPLSQTELFMLDIIDQTWLTVMRSGGAPSND